MIYSTRFGYYMSMHIVNTLTPKHIRQLHKLYQKEWWTENRTLAEIQKAVENSQILIAMVTLDGWVL